MWISIITINYNNKVGLIKTISSVLCQTNHDFEYIVVDGKSSDGSVDVIKRFSLQIDKQVVEPDKGIYDAMNKGIAMAEGKYCLFLNSGDCLANKYVIDSVIPYFRSNKDFYTGIENIKGHGRNDYVYPEEKVTVPYMWFANMRHQCTFIRTELLKRRPYLTKFKIVSDWEQNLYELYVNDATYEPMNVLVDIFDYCGMSNQKDVGVRLMNEKYKAFENVFGDRITRWLKVQNQEVWDIWRGDGLDALSRNNRIPNNILLILAKSKGERQRKRYWALVQEVVKLLVRDLFSGKPVV